MYSAFETDPHADTVMRHDLYASRSEQNRHLHEMRRIAVELNRPLAQIMPPYQDLLAAMRARAKVTDFLPVLVARKVRERYKGKQR